MSTKELQEQIASNMRKWQKIEEMSIESTGKIMEKSNNPVIKLVMEMINNDSKFHSRVQGFIADSLEKEAIVFFVLQGQHRRVELFIIDEDIGNLADGHIVFIHNFNPQNSGVMNCGFHKILENAHNNLK